MNKTVPVSCVDLVAVFIVEESSYIFEGLSNSANSRSLDALPRVAFLAPTTCTAVAFVHGKAIARPYFCQALPC